MKIDSYLNVIITFFMASLTWLGQNESTGPDYSSHEQCNYHEFTTVLLYEPATSVNLTFLVRPYNTHRNN